MVVVKGAACRCVPVCLAAFLDCFFFLCLGGFNSRRCPPPFSPGWLRQISTIPLNVMWICREVGMQDTMIGRRATGSFIVRDAIEWCLSGIACAG